VIILCNILIDKELPSKIVFSPSTLEIGTRVLRWWSGIHDTGCVQGPSTRIGTYHIGSCADGFVPAGCGFLQNADDLVVYVALLIG
jgi:hypothetical protein